RELESVGGSRFRRGAKQPAILALSTPKALKRHACAFLFVLFLLRTRKGHPLAIAREKALRAKKITLAGDFFISFSVSGFSRPCR
ncbi:MAG: hypothetical protein J5832_06005, partial [Clostridia bacterium]|nr:hypothetical protein [Clostridia bacterium]